jgi:hypothetical protein
LSALASTVKDITNHPLADNHIDLLDWQFDIFNLALDDTNVKPWTNTDDLRDGILEPVLGDVLPCLGS